MHAFLSEFLGRSLNISAGAATDRSVLFDQYAITKCKYNNQLGIYKIPSPNPFLNMTLSSDRERTTT